MRTSGSEILASWLPPKLDLGVRTLFTIVQHNIPRKAVNVMSSPKKAQDTAAPSGVASEAPKRDRPKWYYRLILLTIKKYRDVEDEDFDEDLSELEESDDAGDKSDCEDPVCNCEDSDCECDHESLASSLEDNLSERSYT
ncbi:hypothetical protein Cpir12675_000546 [Ceratocystis pirilliformis]|uniref:Uncharacterized protein n=1 Tax=Ceratocystis pirilliformis TaxID=259994 RepID=A0ABR3ZKQ5_9PEZI